MNTRSQLESKLVALSEQAITLAGRIAHKGNARSIHDNELYVLEFEINQVSHDLEILAAAEMVD